MPLCDYALAGSAVLPIQSFYGGADRVCEMNGVAMSCKSGVVVKELAKQAIRTPLQKTIRLLAAITKTKADHVDHIHRLRTETRRADAALRLFGDWLPGHRRKWIQKRLGELREKAGRVRDLDVLIRWLPGLEGQLPEKASNWLLDRAGSCRTVAMRSLRHCGRNLMDQDFKKRARALRHRTHWQNAADAPTVGELYAQKVGELASEFLSKIDSLSRDATQCHKVRILGRRLRYTLELLKDVLPETPTMTICRQLSELQDELGSVNDRTVALQYFIAWRTEWDEKPFTESLCRLMDREQRSTVEQLASIVCRLRDKADDMRCRIRELMCLQ